MTAPARDRSTAYAILGGCALIALALYAGLRKSGDASNGGAGAGTASQAPVPMTRTDVEAAIARALDAQKPLFRERCWAPALAKIPAPFESTYDFDIAVSAQGVEIARGVTDGPGARPDIGECLRTLVAPISIPPPNAPMSARITVKLP